MKLNEVIVKA